MRDESVVRAELAIAEDAIGRAYWAFTRRVRARPPSSVCPGAYRDRARFEAELREIRRARVRTRV